MQTIKQSLSLAWEPHVHVCDEVFPALTNNSKMWVVITSLNWLLLSVASCSSRILMWTSCVLMSCFLSLEQHGLSQYQSVLKLSVLWHPLAFFLHIGLAHMMAEQGMPPSSSSFMSLSSRVKLHALAILESFNIFSSQAVQTPGSKFNTDTQVWYILSK